MLNPFKCNRYLLPLCLWLVFYALSLAQGCGTSSKTKTSTQIIINVDSLHKVETARIKKIEEDRKRKELAKTKSELKIKFQLPVKKDSAEKKDTTPTDVVITHERGKIKIHSNKPLKEVNVNEEDLKELTNSEHTLKTDSSGEKKTDSLSRTENAKTEIVQKKRTSIAWWVYVLGGLLLFAYVSGVIVNKTKWSWVVLLMRPKRNNA